MKQTIVLIFVLMSAQLIAQNNKTYLGLAPAGLINKLRLSVEKEMSPKLSAGAVFSYYYGANWKGPKLDLNVRYYLTKKAQGDGYDGLYGVFQAGLASFKTPYTGRTSLGGIAAPYFLDNERSLAYGFGPGIGYRKTINKFFIDTNFRFQLWYLQTKPTILVDGTNQQDIVRYEPFTESGLSFRSVGPGALFAPTVIVGYIF